MIIESRGCSLTCLNKAVRNGDYGKEYLPLVKGGGRTQLEVNDYLWE